VSEQGFFDLRNQLNKARWAWRWSAQGGTYFSHARPLQDLRNDEDRSRWRLIEFKRRHLPMGRRVVNLAAVRIERARKARRERVSKITETWDARRG
jgi:hypothetical protein